MDIDRINIDLDLLKTELGLVAAKHTKDLANFYQH